MKFLTLALLLVIVLFPTKTLANPEVISHKNIYVYTHYANLDQTIVGAQVKFPENFPKKDKEQYAEKQAISRYNDVNTALAYLRKSKHANMLFYRLVKRNIPITIITNSVCEDLTYNTTENLPIVLWDPHCGHLLKNGPSSPAMALFHELVHVVHLLESPGSYQLRTFEKDPDYTDKEEKLTILEDENAVAAELGNEALRYDHNIAFGYMVYNPIKH